MIPVRPVAWEPCYRIIPSRFPPIDLFERVVDPADLDAVLELESLTNPRLRDEVGELQLVPPEDRISGPGSSAIMAAFTHLNPEGSRFTNGTYGVFYAGKTLETAIAETRHHRARFMGATNQAAAELDMRVYVVDLKGDLYDLRGLQATYPAVYDRDSYAASQPLANDLRKQGSAGIVYDSVRDAAGRECAAVFRPPVLSHCRQERHLCYVWDGQAISNIYEKRALP